MDLSRIMTDSATFETSKVEDSRVHDKAEAGPERSLNHDTEHLKEEPQAYLPRNTLYVALYNRSQPPVEDDFHWAYYFHTGKDGGGIKYHVREVDQEWRAEHCLTHQIFESSFLCVLIRVATVPETKHELLDQMIRAHDGHLDQVHKVSSSRWLLTVMQDLIDEEIVDSIDTVDELRQEFLEFGNQNSLGAVQMEQPRLVVESKLCL